MVSLDYLVRCSFISKLPYLFFKFIVEHVRQALVEDEGQNEVFELRCICCTTNGACSIPKPRF
jgi:hypothetical protein